MVCEHGNVKSLMAASYFNELATARHLPFRAISRGRRPTPTTVPPPIIDGLKSDGFDVAGFHPTAISAADIASANRVILINTSELAADLSPARGRQPRSGRTSRLPARLRRGHAAATKRAARSCGGARSTISVACRPVGRMSGCLGAFRPRPFESVLSLPNVRGPERPCRCGYVWTSAKAPVDPVRVVFPALTRTCPGARQFCRQRRRSFRLASSSAQVPRPSSKFGPSLPRVPAIRPGSRKVGRGSIPQSVGQEFAPHAGTSFRLMAAYVSFTASTH